MFRIKLKYELSVNFILQIKFSFLMVGHTHEDVDQFFSRISTKANQQAAVTLPDLQNIIATAVDPEPTVYQLTNLWDFRSLSEEAQAKFELFKECHTFKFILTEEGKVKLKYKNWPLKLERYCEEDITDIVPEFVHGPPVCQHNTVKLRPILDKMEEDLDKWVNTGRFSLQHREWWKTYLTELRRPPAQPEIPLPHNFGKFITPKVMPPTLDQTVMDVINRHIKKLTQKSTIKITRKRQRRQ